MEFWVDKVQLERGYTLRNSSQLALKFDLWFVISQIKCLHFKVRWVMEFLTWGAKLGSVYKNMNGPQGNFSILWIDIACGLKKLGRILEIKAPPNLKTAKQWRNRKGNWCDPLTLFHPGGRFRPCIAKVAPKNSLGIHICKVCH